MPYCLHIIIVVNPIYQEFFNTVMVVLLLYGASKVEVPGLPYRNADPLEFSECASIASPRRPCLSVQSTRVWPQGRQ